MALRIRRRGKTLSAECKHVELAPGDVLLYRGLLIDDTVLESMLSTNKRLLWAFVKHQETGDIMAVPYDEAHVVWLAESDIEQPRDIEV